MPENPRKVYQNEGSGEHQVVQEEYDEEHAEDKPVPDEYHGGMPHEEFQEPCDRGITYNT
jgi:hypothetical protein